MCAAHNLSADLSRLTFCLPQPFTVPKDAFDITLLTRNIGICTEKGIVVADPIKCVAWCFSGRWGDLTCVVQFDEWDVHPRSRFH